jgi:hypothetical protein
VLSFAWRELTVQGADLASERFKFIDGLEVMLQRDSLPMISKLEGLIQKSQDTPQSKALLILDSLDVLLSVGISAQAVVSFVSSMRRRVHSVLVNLRADVFLDHPSALQVQHQQLLMTLLHQANVSISLRMLSSGQAQDVSGITSIQSSHPECQSFAGKEFLYHINPDLSVRLWERGTERP